LRSVNAVFLSLHVGAGLNVFEVQENVALFDVIAFLDGDVRNLADALTEDVGVVFRPDFARGSDERYEILARGSRGLDGGDTLIRFINAVPGDTADQHYHTSCNRRLLPGLHYLSSGQGFRHTYSPLDRYARARHNVSRPADEAQKAAN